MKNDIEISQSLRLRPITEVAKEIGITEEEILPYGRYKAKVSLSLLDRLKDEQDGKLVLVTAMTPTPSGEGKTTVAIGLSQALNRLGVKSMVTLREPSLGPIFGMKGVGTGGGYSQVVPMEDINLHFTGDISAVSSANNLLSAMLDNHIYRNNPLKIDPNHILWRRCMDTSDRELRHIVVGVGEETTGITRSEHFIISAASEVMAILCLAKDRSDLKERLGNIVVAFTFDGRPVSARDLNAHRAMNVLLHEAILPNLVQTVEGTAAFVHGGPFANIAHGTSSLISLRMALKLSDIVITEAGFGSDLGAEKFFNIVSRVGNLKVGAVVIVASLQALRYHGGAKKKEMALPNPEFMKTGIPNLLKHIENVRRHGLEPVVALNKREGDSEEEVKMLSDVLNEQGVRFAVAEVHAKGGEGGIFLAKEVMAVLESHLEGPRFLYPLESPLEEKVRTIAKEMYGMGHVVFTRKAREKMEQLKELGVDRLPICMAKTQYSLSNNPKIRGVPEPNMPCTITDISLSAGAGFVVVYTENINLMPGLPRHPRVEDLDMDEEGWIKGLD